MLEPPAHPDEDPLDRGPVTSQLRFIRQLFLFCLGSFHRSHIANKAKAGEVTTGLLEDGHIIFVDRIDI
jgi:hypothetical protein